MTATQARLVKPGKRLNYVVLPSKDTKYVKEKAGAYFLEPKKGLTLNNQAITTEQQLKDGDEITLVESFLGIKSTTEWVFQSDPVKAKADRIASEKAKGIIPTLPDTTTGSRDLEWLNKHFTADQNMVYADHKEIPWADLDRVLFWKVKKGYMSIGLIGAATGALKGMTAIAEEANGASEYDVTFRDGTWDVIFSTKEKKNNATIHGVNASNCVIIAQIIDFYSPMDLIQVFTQMAT